MVFVKGYIPTQETIEKIRKYNKMYPNKGTFKKGHHKN